MGITSLLLKLEPHQEVYFPGQTVMGAIQTQVSSEVSCTAVEIKFKGSAKVKWTESHNDNHTVYSASEDYFRFKTNIWTPQGSNWKLPSGNHVWPFNFIIPQNIPSSFEGPYGSVRYSITVNADLSFRFDESHKIYININCPVDLNFLEQARAHLVIKTVDSSCFLCCTRGPVSININCPRSGAVVGEHFKLRGEINNRGSTEVERVSVALHQKVTYHTKRKNRKCCSTVTTLEKGAISPGDSCYLQDDPLLIHAVVPMLSNCSIMTLSYELEVRADFGCCSKVKGASNFFIGTVPFVVEGGESGYPANAPTLPIMGSAAPSAPRYFGTATNYPVPSAPAVNSPPEVGAIGFVSEKSKEEIPPPPPGFVQVEPSVPDTAWPPAAPVVPNPYPNHSPPGAESCWFCVNGRSRIDRKAPAPKYLSYRGCF
ncbi:Arrestin C-terminal-like domain [Trinorchestia longiramus]|nr:Arrestin C-terminal-like domain [Trinorchestia longiramus]